MKKTTTSLMVATGLGMGFLALSACKNPADETADAKVGEAVEKTASAAEGVRYEFTDDSKIEFVGSKVTGSHNGGFKDFEGYLTLKDGMPVGNDHKVTIDMNSTWSDDDNLTDHLKNEDFFHVEKFPESVFDVTSIEPVSDQKWSIAGNLTLHGVTKNIGFEADVQPSEDALHLKAEFDINRKDFGIIYSGRQDDLIRDEVIIRFDLKAKPASQS